MTVDAKTTERALRLRKLGESLLVLPNAWDAGSAAVIVAAGAPAIATTSGGVAWSIGRGDGQHATRAEMLEAAARIVAAVDVPVSVDVEGGYEDVAATVREVVAVGAVGINLEDSKASDGTLYTPAEQAGRIRAARGAAAAAGLPELVINARTDVFLFGIGEESGRLADVLARVEAYAAAGADGIFVPGLLDLEALGEIAKGALPVNAMAGPGGPSVAELAGAGVRRVSVGTGVAQSAYAAARAAAVELLGQGTYGSLGGSLDYSTLNGLFVK
ncbi:isocitrate lyase/phosphoenolpyruvate mutase family protein [Streptomyces sp. ISL-66]|uniref:isocitrate lyase/PEP mutase family protein n=1 Tax=Streptomyces sp. ISL-66 TaxID=2819186 RepID=UPI001BEBC2ED|nr:isocitrate lyase/phosphoenolpyruvate mutase family protein [Streptomyces sp. ISL-66]MBT2466331.1 isocitrate lyase/phosphoenolpyruvate mutase family protein [Streptomyces sp. ISL-66]